MCSSDLLTPDLWESERPGPVASPPVGYRLFLRSYALEKQGISAWRLYGRVKRAAVRRLFFFAVARQLKQYCLFDFQ